jgi:AraC-like DNA-binding protein
MFLPPLIVFVYCLYAIYPGSGIEQTEYLRPMVLTDPSFMEIPLYWQGIYILIAGAKLYFVMSITPMLLSLFSLWLKGRSIVNAGLLRVGSFFALVMNLTVLLSFAGDFISISMVKGAVITANILICIHYIVSQRNPDYIRMVKIVIHKAKYAQSYIKGIDIDSLKNRLYEIMELEKAFADEDINLKSIADELGVTTHQLSQLLNEKIKKNFNTFVNEFRVNEAKEILLDEPDRSILSISFAVGFNSYVTFCNVFSKIAGMTPSQFRKKNKKGQ